MLYVLNHAHRKGRQIVKREKEIFALKICVFVVGGLAGKFKKPDELKENQETLEVLFPVTWGLVFVPTSRVHNAKTPANGRGFCSCWTQGSLCGL